VTQNVLLVLLPGALALFGSFGGAYLSRKVEDSRRWHGDRRELYAKYLGLTSLLLNDIDGLGVYHPDNLQRPMLATETEHLDEGFSKYVGTWARQLQPALGEIQLLASAEVADLADRASSALFKLYAAFGKSSLFEFIGMMRRTADLVSVLRDAMRRELGVSSELKPHGHSADWPWLPDRPPLSAYVEELEEEEVAQREDKSSTGDSSSAINQP
jgi:hypothetical protein